MSSRCGWDWYETFHQSNFTPMAFNYSITRNINPSNSSACFCCISSLADKTINYLSQWKFVRGVPCKNDCFSWTAKESARRVAICLHHSPVVISKARHLWWTCSMTRSRCRTRCLGFVNADDDETDGWLWDCDYKATSYDRSYLTKECKGRVVGWQNLYSKWRFAIYALWTKPPLAEQKASVRTVSRTLEDGGRFRKRIHFHEWMIDVHSRLHKKQKGILAADCCSMLWGHRDRSDPMFGEGKKFFINVLFG